MNELYLVQVGKGSQGRYTTKYSVSSRSQANLLYGGVNLDDQHKKRLIINGETKPIFCEFGWR